VQEWGYERDLATLTLRREEIKLQGGQCRDLVERRCADRWSRRCSDARRCRSEQDGSSER
jgi:hypothetical protein